MNWIHKSELILYYKRSVDEGEFKGTFDEYKTWFLERMEGIDLPHVIVNDLNSLNIEDFGFALNWSPNCYTEDDDIQQGYELELDNDTTIIIHYNKETGEMGIVKQHVYNEFTGNWSALGIFKGIIKTYDEFEVLLKQLKILNH